ncbi:hypothetical protein JHV56_18800 [Arthrobacter sp. BHU FT2]|nr:hypothetical protein [Arthrobacter sp. BHU FT2]
MNRPGHTRITPAALRKTIEAVTCQAFGISPGDASASLHDDGGKLGVDLLVRLPAPPLLAADPGGRDRPLFERADIARLKVSFMGREVTGMEIGRINIRLGAA